jgi:hypothetical protein
MKKSVKEIVFGFLVLFGILIFSSFVSAGIGIKWSEESALVKEGGKACLTYSVYNPWDEETYATIGLSGELSQIMTMQESEAKVIPAQTSSSQAIPVSFCFQVPRIYKQDCMVGSFICKQECKEERQVYSGEVLVSTLPNPNQITGTGGSSTQMSVSAPIRVRVECTPHSRDYTLVYILLAAVSGVVVFIVLFRRYRKPKAQRDREKLLKLKAQIAKDENKGTRKKSASKKK